MTIPNPQSPMNIVTNLRFDSGVEAAASYESFGGGPSRLGIVKIRPKLFFECDITGALAESVLKTSPRDIEHAVSKAIEDVLNSK